MTATRIPVLRVNQNSRVFYLTKLKAEQIKDFTVVDRHRPDLPIDHPAQGYQRIAEPSRYKKFANYLLAEDHPFCPTALLLSARDTDLRYDPKDSSIELNSKDKLQIIDGQHRAEGYRYAIYDKRSENLNGFEVPVLIMPDIDKFTEMIQFKVINGTQKSVRTDLVNTILTKVAATKGEETLKNTELASVVVTRVVEALNSDPNSAWYDMIIMPNERSFTKQEKLEDPAKAYKKLVLATSFMTSLKPTYRYLNEFGFLRGDAKDQSRALASIMNEYWNAIKSLVPDAFSEPPLYVIQKTPGLFALHSLCWKVMKNLHLGGYGWSISSFTKVLERSESLRNPEFWEAGGGEASKYGSMKGFSELSRIIEEEIYDAENQRV